MKFNKPIFGSNEEVFMIVESTPELEYDVFYTGSSEECIEKCITIYKCSKPELYRMYNAQEHVNFIILSLKLVNKSCDSFPRQRYTESLHNTGSI